MGAGQRPPLQPAPSARGVGPSSHARSPAASWPLPARPGSATRRPCTPSRTRRSPSTAPGEGLKGDRPREGGKAALGSGPIKDQRRRWLGRRAAEPLPLAQRWHETAVGPGAQVPAAAGEVTGGRGRRVGPGAPASIPPAARLAGSAPSSGFGRNPTIYTRCLPKREGDARSHLRSGRHAARRQLGCRETPRRAPPPPRETEGSQGGCRRARCLHSLRPTPFPRRIVRRSLQSPRAGGEGDGRGGAPPRGRIRALVSLIGIYLSNGTTNTPSCTLTDFSSIQ